MFELSTFCRIDTCAIMYSPYESQPKVVHGLNFGDINDLNLLLIEKMSNIYQRMDAFAMTPLYAREASSSLSLSMVALPPITMVMPKVMQRTGTKDTVQSGVNDMDPMKRQ
ncbi:hypothetical protein PVK06_002465 [Gossypium arboreum]|uniref:Uncharacterized protein n=1 Tax=Gossypium arboreum TaxID=29729 RepID=A0ABR0R3M1_GOSAR|nr:hypothetical protein PVK06_002465 [Gossypium arboreum]